MAASVQNQEKAPGHQNAAVEATTRGPVADDKEPYAHDVEQHPQRGVQKIEAMTAAWTRKSLLLAYAAIFLVFYVNSLQQQISGNLNIYVTSSFAAHPLTATTTVISSVIGAVAKLPIAKIIDIWGRTEGYVLMIFLATLGVALLRSEGRDRRSIADCNPGLIMMAACNNVETYAAAQVFYWVGYDGIAYVLDVTMADTSSLKNRAWLFAFSTCPYIANTFAGPAAAQQFYKHSSRRWGYGSFAIIVPAVCTPLIIIFLINRRKALQLGYVPEAKSGRTVWESARHYAIEFDVVGVILISAAFALFLLPFSLASSSAQEWRTPHIVVMIILGGLLFPVFLIWEKFFAPVCFAPFRLLIDQTVLGGCLLGAILFISFYCWDIYFTSYLQVVYDLSIADAGYVYNIYNIGSCFFSVIIGFVIRGTGNFKYVALSAIPIQILGTALMLHFRQPDKSIGYVIMCQILIALSGGTLVICEQIAVMAAAAHYEVAVVLAFLGLFTSIGGAIGQTVAAAIYTNTMPGALQKYLPDNAKSQAIAIYSSITTQLQYPMGSPVREAIIRAYGDVMRRLCVAGLCFLPLAFIFVLMWRNINVKTVKQVKGTVV
ncbi:hypothetical protein VTN77DRAFT_4803 [Rasamsonia byssochlamydoides]|uniref:uncharacterized protein n=1 Tax=Rasamsonia byssochlamydoides TaxID=89139 RepID=UPI003743E8BC